MTGFLGEGDGGPHYRRQDLACQTMGMPVSVRCLTASPARSYRIDNHLGSLVLLLLLKVDRLITIQ